MNSDSHNYYFRSNDLKYKPVVLRLNISQMLVVMSFGQYERKHCTKYQYKQLIRPKDTTGSWRQFWQYMNGRHIQKGPGTKQHGETRCIHRWHLFFSFLQNTGHKFIYFSKNTNSFRMSAHRSGYYPKALVCLDFEKGGDWA